MIYNGDENINPNEISIYFDFRANKKEKIYEMYEKQKNRRILKTHLPLNALVFSPKAKYIYVARDGRDVAFSFYNHYKNYTQESLNILNESPGLFGKKFIYIYIYIYIYF